MNSVTFCGDFFFINKLEHNGVEIYFCFKLKELDNINKKVILTE